MKVIFALLGVLPAVVYADSSAAMAFISPFLPPECHGEIDSWVKESHNTYSWLTNEKCKECPNGVKFNALVFKEELAKRAINAYLDYLAAEGFDIDKLCTHKFRRKELWPIYNKLRADCIISQGETSKHPDLCKAKDADFPKTSKCIKDEATKIFDEKANPPPMDCLQKGLAKCTKAYMGKWRTHFFDSMKNMKKDSKIPGGLNVWATGRKFFATKCTGKF